MPEVYVYEPDPKMPHGPKWKTTRPHGLPAHARLCSTSQDGERLLRHYLAVALAIGLSKAEGASFTELMLNLARGESGCRLGRAADIYDTRPAAERPKQRSKTGKLRLKKYISAWGIFSWNRDCLQSVTHDKRLPHDLTVEEELRIPIDKYLSLWNEAMKVARCHRDAALAIRYWHALPGGYKTLIKRAKEMGFAKAWLLTDPVRRAITERHLGGIKFADEMPASKVDVAVEHHAQLAATDIEGKVQNNPMRKGRLMGAINALPRFVLP